MSTSGNASYGWATSQADGQVVAATRPHPSHLRIAARYALLALGCIGFNLIYAQFAHGVSSAFMSFMFAIPLAMGAAPALAMHLAKVRPVPLRARQAWALAIACLTVASCLHGIFDIAGTASPYLVVYVAAAAACAVAAAAASVRQVRKTGNASMRTGGMHEMHGSGCVCEDPARLA